MTWRKVEEIAAAGVEDPKLRRGRTNAERPFLPRTKKVLALQGRLVETAKSLDQAELAECLRVAKSRRAISELESDALDALSNRIRYLATQLDIAVTPDVFGLPMREIKIRYATSVAKKIKKGLTGQLTKNIRNENYDEQWRHRKPEDPTPERYIDVPLSGAEYRDSFSHGRSYKRLTRYMREGGLSAKDIGLSATDLQALVPRKDTNN